MTFRCGSTKATLAEVHFCPVCICMVPAILSVVAFLALLAWRFAFAGLRRRPLTRGIAAPQRRHTIILEQGLHILDLAAVSAIPGNRPENSSNGASPNNPKDCAKAYLRRIVALTGGTQVGNCYVLDVGATRFHVRDRYVRRMRDVTDPKCEFEETCFYVAEKEMPKSEHIATALLQLKNNPALFDQWAARSGTFKADGQAFDSAQ
jgi:hypothetical protein